MILFLHGADDFLVNRRRRALQAAFVKKYPEAEVFVFDFEDQGGSESVRRALAACAAGLFATRKLVVFLHPFALEEAEGKMFLDFLKDFVKTDNPATLLCVAPEKIRKTQSVASFLLKKSDQTEAFEKLDEKDTAGLTRRIEQELKALGMDATFAPAGLRAFVAAVGNDSARAVSELEKLVAYKAGGSIEAEDVTMLVAARKEEAIFQALDALGRGDKKQALFLLRREAEKPEGVYPVWGMCAWQVRQLIRVREPYDRGARQAGAVALQAKLSPYVAQKLLSVIAAFPMERLRRGLALLSDSDTRMKTGALDPLVALDLFVWKL